MQHRRERHAGIVRQRVAQRQRAVRRQFDDQPLRQRLDAIVVLRIALRLGWCVAADDTDDDPWASLRPGCVRSIAGDGIGSRHGTAFDRLDRRLVLAPDIAALDAQSAVGVDADEHAGAGDFGGIIGDRPFVECRERGLDLAEPRVHLVRQLHGVGVFLLQGVMLGPQRIAGRAFLFGESDGLPGQAAQPVGVAIRKVEPRPRSTSSPPGATARPRLAASRSPAGRAAPGPAASRHRRPRTGRAARCRRPPHRRRRRRTCARRSPARTAPSVSWRRMK